MNIDIEKPSFKQLVLLNMQQLTNFPYIEKDFDAITDYQLLCKVVEYLNDVIKNQKISNEAVLGLYNAFITLKDYVDNYFTNLDVQDEINNKLDEMAESGQLTDIIAQYLGLAGMITFNTVTEMKQATNLVNGSKCCTLGYHEVNDSGKGIYKIRTITNVDVIDEGSIISLNDNTLIAELIVFEINPVMFGCYGDNIQDDTINLQKAINYAITNKIPIYSIKNKTYKITDTIIIDGIIELDFKNSEINGNFNDDMIKITVTDTQGYDEDKTKYYVFGGYIKNLILNGNNECTKGLYVELNKKMEFNNIEIVNCLTGLYVASATESVFNIIRIQGCETGLYNNAADVLFENIFGRFCNIGMILNTYSQIINSHFWLRENENEFDNSIYAKVYNGARLENVQIDNYETGIETLGTGSYTLQMSGLWQQPTNSTKNYTLFKFSNASFNKKGISVRLNNFTAVCKETTPYVNFSDINADTFEGFINYNNCRFLRINKFPLSTHTKLTDISSNIEEIYNRVTYDGHMVKIDFVGKVITSFHDLTIAKLPNIVYGENPAVPMGFVGSTSNQYNLSSNDITFPVLVLRNHNIMIRTSGDTDIPIDKYVHIHLLYIADSEQDLNENVPV